GAPDDSYSERPRGAMVVTGSGRPAPPSSFEPRGGGGHARPVLEGSRRGSTATARDGHRAARGRLVAEGRLAAHQRQRPDHLGALSRPPRRHRRGRVLQRCSGRGRRLSGVNAADSRSPRSLPIASTSPPGSRSTIATKSAPKISRWKSTQRMARYSLKKT